MSWIRKTSLIWGIALAFVYQNSPARADDHNSLTHAAPYVPESPLSGEIRIVCTEAMQQLAVLWERGFLSFHPDVDFGIECKSTMEPVVRTAPSKKVVRLIGHQLSDQDVRRTDSEAGIETRACFVGQELLAAVVHPDNPIISLE